MELIVLVLHHHLSLKNFHRCLTFLIILTVVSFFPLSFLRLFFTGLLVSIASSSSSSWFEPSPLPRLSCGWGGIMMTLLSPVPFRTCLAGAHLFFILPPPAHVLRGGGMFYSSVVTGCTDSASA